MPEFNEAQYGDKKRLADAGLGRKEVATSTGGDAMVGKLPTGRPVSSGAPVSPMGNAPAQGNEELLEPGDAERQLMHMIAEADSAYGEAQQYLNVPGAGSWVQFLVDLAKESTYQIGLRFNNNTPDWNLE